MDGILTINQPAALVKALFWIKAFCVREDFDQRGKGACAAVRGRAEEDAALCRRAQLRLSELGLHKAQVNVRLFGDGMKMCR